MAISAHRCVPDSKGTALFCRRGTDARSDLLRRSQSASTAERTWRTVTCGMTPSTRITPQTRANAKALRNVAAVKMPRRSSGGVGVMERALADVQRRLRLRGDALHPGGGVPW